MKSVKCARCGLINWVEAGECKRCGNLLALLEEVTSATTAEEVSAGDTTPPAAHAEEETRVCSFCGTEFKGYFCPLCRKHAREAPAPGREVEQSLLASLLPSWKTKAAACLVLALAAAGALYAAGRFGRGGDADKFQAELIRSSESFSGPVSFAVLERAKEQTGPGVHVLRELGLVRLRTVETTPEPAADAQATEEGAAQLAPVKFTQVELTEEGRRESAGWAQSEEKVAADGGAKKTAGARVWAVPVGEREFLGVSKVYQTSPGVYELSTVEFTWRWKPNDIGRYFDVRSGEHAGLTDGVRRGAAQLGLDSEAIRAGKATLRYDGKRWAVQDVTFDEATTTASAND